MAARHPPELKRRGVQIAVDSGNVSEASRQLGVATQTISRWISHPANADIVAFARSRHAQAGASVCEGLEPLAEHILELAREAKTVDDAKTVRDLSISFGILVDASGKLLSSGGGVGRYGTPAPQNEKVMTLIQQVQS